MPITEYIGGIECVFPESKEKSFKAFADALAAALIRSVLDGRITKEEFEKIIEEDEND